MIKGYAYWSLAGFWWLVIQFWDEHSQYYNMYARMRTVLKGVCKKL
jgi:hypothetical protein